MTDVDVCTLFGARTDLRVPYGDEVDLGTRGGADSEFVEGRALFRADVATAAEAEELARRAVCETFPEAATDPDALNLRISVRPAQGSFMDAAEAIYETLEEW